MALKRNFKPLFFSLSDHGATAVALFAFNSIVARSLGISEYGQLATMLAFVSLLGATSNQFFTEPTVVLSAKQPTNSQSVSGASNRLFIALAFLFFSAMSIAKLGHGLGGAEFEIVYLVFLAICSEGFVSYANFIKRLSYGTDKNYIGFVVSVANLLTLAVLLIAAFMKGDASSIEAAFWVRIAASLVAACIGNFGLRAELSGTFKDAAILEPVKRLWLFSRLLVLGAVIFWLTGAVNTALIGTFISAEAAAGYRAVQLLFLPLVQFHGAVFQLALPRIAAFAGHQGESAPKSQYRLLGSLVLPTFLFGAVLVFGMPWLLNLVFGPEFISYSWMGKYLFAIVLSDSFKQYFVLIFYAYESQRDLLAYRIFSLLTFFALVVPAMIYKNIDLVMMALLFANLLQLAFLAALSKKLEKRNKCPIF